ncbi:hypothetical protein [Rhizobium ruizarguesonis]|uniref:hypothetical protein n=1 Tax=Rhizobium ruizarguesonis TaxID=2081791 RepID=UPI002E163770|nr:hypothetical protein U8Q07_05960 [Rhizobium ruizarguesonis]WSH34848.1 hypothetical protein U8P70_05955 [Rhizobium ruizarguesonis]
MSVFLKLIDVESKNEALKREASNYRLGKESSTIFERTPADLGRIPGTPFAYWVSDSVLEAFSFKKFDDEENGRSTRCGLGTLDDFRFLRAFWEVSSESDYWVIYYNGGVFSRFYDEFPLAVRWFSDGKEVCAFVEMKVGSASRKVQGADKYFSPGFVFPRRTKGFSPKFMPRGGIFSTGGQAGFASIKDIPATIAFLSSYACTFLISLSQGRTGDAAQYEVGQVKRLPWPGLGQHTVILSEFAHRAWRLKRDVHSASETSRAFLLPAALRDRLGGYDPEAAEAEIGSIQSKIDAIAFDLYRFSQSDCEAALETTVSAEVEIIEVAEDADENEDEDRGEPIDLTVGLLSWAIGVSFGRFDWRFATGERETPPEPDPFDPLPAKSPGMLPDGAAPFHDHNGILLDDQGHPHDLPRLIEEVLARVDAEVPGEVRRWLQRDFFPQHLKQYSKSRRKAPIYWPLSTTSGSYTLWLYYPNLTSQTLYTAVNDFVEPKLKQVSRDTATLRDKGATRSRDDEKTFEALQTLELELIELRDTLLQIAPTYRPNHDDGVQITAAPLSQLFRHKPWQKILKDTWAKLEKGDYDWAHLAMAYWPERVREKCKTDKSLAIAHYLEELYVEPEPKSDSKKKAGK